MSASKPLVQRQRLTERIFRSTEVAQSACINLHLTYKEIGVMFDWVKKIWQGNPMKIVMTAQISVSSEPGTAEIVDPVVLSKLGNCMGNGNCLEHADLGGLDDIRLEGGSIQLVYDDLVKRVKVRTEYQASKKLSKKQLDALVETTQNQWSDGVGSSAFNSIEDRLKIHIDLWPVNASDSFQVDQIAEPKVSVAKKGNSAKLFKAITAGDVAATQKEIELGAPLEDVRNGSTPLIEAITCGHPEIVEILLKQGADINVITRMGLTALQTCVLSNASSDDASAAIAQILLAHGADPFAKSSRGSSVFEFPAFKEKVKCAEVINKHAKR